MTKPNGVTVYRGPGTFTGRPVLGKLHGLYRASNNPKTGPGQQAAFVPDIAPEERKNFFKGGRDEDVCGDCAYRWRYNPETGKMERLCYVGGYYVNTMLKTEYPDATGDEVTYGLLRLGSYGSPASVPYEVSERLVTRHPGKHTGYWQEWADPRFQAFGEICMASTSTLEQAEQAWDLGHRTFRVLAPGEEPTKHEILCPHATHGLLCLQCGLCDGNTTKAKSIANPAHGPAVNAEKFNVLQEYLRGKLAAAAAGE